MQNLYNHIQILQFMGNLMWMSHPIFTSYVINSVVHTILTNFVVISFMSLWLRLG